MKSTTLKNNNNNNKTRIISVKITTINKNNEKITQK